MSHTRRWADAHSTVLTGAAAAALLPVFPQFQEFHLVVEACVLEQKLNVFARETPAEPFWAVRNIEDGYGGDRGVVFQRPRVDFVERVGAGVIDGDVIFGFLHGDECGNPLEQKIEVVGAEKSRGAVIVSAAAVERGHGFTESFFELVPAVERIALDLAGAHVVDDDGGDGVELFAVCPDVPE